jgi:hypothetical protein
MKKTMPNHYKKLLRKILRSEAMQNAIKNFLLVSPLNKKRAKTTKKRRGSAPRVDPLLRGAAWGAERSFKLVFQLLI